MSETGVAFAHVWLCGVETGIAFACEKWVFLVRFLGAVVMPVSVVRCWGCAVVLLVSMSPWCRVWCATMFARRRCVIAKVRESSPSALKLAPIRRFCVCWASFLRRCRWRGCAGRASSRQLALRWSWMRCGALQGGCGWGFCAMRSPLAACRRRVGGLDGVIPPCGGEATSLGGVAAKVQTHWAKNAENRLFEVNGSALWRIWRVWTHRLRYSALQAR